MKTNLAEKRVLWGNQKGLFLVNRGGILGYRDIRSIGLDSKIKSKDITLKDLELRPDEYKLVPFLVAIKEAGFIIGMDINQYRRNAYTFSEIYEGKKVDERIFGYLMKAQEKNIEADDLAKLVNIDNLRTLREFEKPLLFFPTQRMLEKYVRHNQVYSIKPNPSPSPLA